MKKLRILLTGDDGFNSLGTRILVHFLKRDHDLYIAGTKTQQSGVGGHISAKQGCGYGMDEVDGVPAYWVDGYPADAIESVVDIWPTPFDLVISGINWGANLGYGTCSGTVSAAIRAHNIAITKQSLVLSWDLPHEYWFTHSHGEESLEKFLDYPGKAAYAMVNLALRHRLWGAPMLNINFPGQPSGKVRFTKPLADMKLFYGFPVVRDTTAATYKYPLVIHQDAARDGTTDAGAILNGFISVSLWNPDPLDVSRHHRYAGTEFNITRRSS